MKRLRLYLRRAVLTLGVLLLVVVVGVVLFTRTERFRLLLREQLVGFLNTSFRGEVTLERIEGSVWGDLTLRNLTVGYRGAEILRVPRVTLSYSLLPLLRGRVQVFRLEGFEPVLRLEQYKEGRWNLLEAFSSPVEEPEEASAEEGGLAVLLDTVVLQGANIDLTLSGEDQKMYHLAETALDAQIGIRPSGLEVQVRRLVSRLAAQGLPQLQVEASLAYQDTVSPATVSVSEVKLGTEHSRMRLKGRVGDLSTLDTDAELFIEKLAVSDLVHIFPEWPLKQDLSGTLRVSGSLANLHSNLALAAADAQVTADLQADLSQESPRYKGTIKVAHLDVQKLLEDGGFAGVVDGTVQASGAGASLSELSGEVSVRAQALGMGGWQVGDVSLSGTLDKEVGRLSGEVTGGPGRATWQGEIHLAEGPRYRLALSVEHLDIKPALSLVEGKVAAGEEPVGGELNLKGIVKGKGFTLPEMDAQAEIELLPSTIGPVGVERGRIAARIADGRIRISEATLSAKDTALNVKGEIGTAVEEEGQLSYTLRIEELSPWLSLAGQKGSGALTLSGEARGNFADLRAQGEMQLNALHFGEFTIQRGTTTFDLKGIGRAQPHGTLTAVIHDMHAGVNLQSVEATAALSQGQPQLVQLEVKAREVAARTHSLKAEVSYQPPQIAARLTELSLELPNGTWQISQPVKIVQNGEGLAVEQFLIANRDQQILLDGNISLAGKQNLLLQIDRFALAVLRPVLPRQPEVRGLISARVQIGGTAATPSLVGTASLTDLQIAGQDYAGLSTAVAYKEKQATLELIFQQDAERTLSVTGSLPLSLSWAKEWEAEVLGEMDLRVRSSGLSLAFLNAFSGEAIRDVAGELSLDVVLQGPVLHPLPQGSFELRDGQIRVTPLGVQVSAVTVEGELDPERVRIEQISAKAGKGSLRGSGAITLRDYVPERLAVSLRADRWPAIRTHRYRVKIGGELSCEGPLRAPKVGGRLEVLQATLRPDLAFLGSTPIERDDTIVILPAGIPPEPSAAEEKKNPLPPEEGVFQSLALDLTVLLHRNTWIKQQNAAVELAGEIRAMKRTGEDLALAGTLEAVRGWAAFQGRRFILSRGRVVFSGEDEINPALDIVAQHRLPKYLVEAVVGGTVNDPSLTLRSEPELEQADIIAVLLFGKPASALDEGEQIALQQQAIAITSGYAAAKIGESVSQFLGLDSLGIDLQQIDFTGGRIGFGHYLTRSTYVSASQDLAGKKGHQVSVEYQLTPEWEITTSTSSSGTSGADIFWRKRY